MNTDDCVSNPSEIFYLKPDQIEYLANKILNKKSLNAADRRLIYFAITGDLESISYFNKKKGPKPKGNTFKKLADDVDKLKANGDKISTQIQTLGKNHNLCGLHDVSLDTFNKNLKNGRIAKKRAELFQQIQLARTVK